MQHDDTSPAPAVLLVAHGSRLEPDSSRGARHLTARLAEAWPHRELRCAFWKEQPALREALATLATPRVVVVPLFAAKGWFSRLVVPRELGLDTDAELDRRGERRFARSVPLGAHPAMTAVLAARADEALAAAGLDADRCALVVVGHGTERSSHSARTVLAHAARLRDAGRFAHVEVGFLDQAPALDTLEARLPEHLEHVVVVPCLVADGPHTREDIPRALGLPAAHRDDTVTSARVGHRVLHYTSAAGTHPDVLEVVRACIALGERMLERSDPACDALALPDPWLDALTPARVAASRRALEARLSAAPGRSFVVGQSAVLREPDAGRFRLVHHSDAALLSRSEPALTHLTDLVDLAERRADGRYRALRTGRDLRAGWCFETASFARLVDALELLEPAALTLHPALGGPLPATSWAACAARQSGLLAGMRACSEAQVASLVERWCEACCTRVPGWHRAASPADGEAPRCPEPCPLVRSAGADHQPK